MHKEHDDDNRRESSDDNNDQQSSSITPSNDQRHRVGWINKCWPYKKRHTIEPQSKENNNV